MQHKDTESHPLIFLGIAAVFLHNQRMLRIIQSLIFFCILFLNWLIWSGYTDAFFLVSGVISVIAAMWLARRMGCLPYAWYQSWRAPAYVLWLLKEIVFSSVDVTRRIWMPRLRISPTTGWVTSSQTSDTGQTIFAISITLTPGTVSILVEKDRIFVHGLTQDGVSDLQQDGGMDAKVKSVMGEACYLPRS